MAREAVSPGVVAVRAAVLVIAVVVTGCVARQGTTDSAAGTTQAASTTQAAQPAAGEWRSLMSADAWRGYKETSLPSGWHFMNGELMKEGNVNDIVTKDQFVDFELEFDWKVAARGNAGIFYRGTEEYEKIYWSAPEYQLLDDAGHVDAKDRRTAAAANYALDPSPAGLAKPAGEWNSGRIVVRGAHVEHWLNGRKAVEYELWSPKWESEVKASKFVDWKNYGRAKRGHIAVQGDHEGPLSLRNIRIREIS